MIRRFPSWLHVAYLVAGFFTFGMAWVAWWLHAFLFYVLITRRDRQRVRRVLEDIVLAVVVANLIENRNGGVRRGQDTSITYRGAQTVGPTGSDV